jgi:HEAT repeat protein
LGGQDIDVRWNAADALGKLKDVRAVEPLIWALKDEDEFVRERAADALGRIGDEGAVWPLSSEAVSDDCEDVKVTAKEALVKIGKRR